MCNHRKNSKRTSKNTHLRTHAYSCASKSFAFRPRPLFKEPDSLNPELPSVSLEASSSRDTARKLMNSHTMACCSQSLRVCISLIPIETAADVFPPPAGDVMRQQHRQHVCRSNSCGSTTTKLLVSGAAAKVEATCRCAATRARTHASAC